MWKKMDRGVYEFDNYENLYGVTKKELFSKLLIKNKKLITYAWGKTNLSFHRIESEY